MTSAFKRVSSFPEFRKCGDAIGTAAKPCVLKNRAYLRYHRSSFEAAEPVYSRVTRLKQADGLSSLRSLYVVNNFVQ
jgi:hypothetical protein